MRGLGTALLIVLPESLRFLKSVPGLYLAIYGLSIILIIRYMPDGIWGFVQDRVRRWLPPLPFAGAPAELALVPAQAATQADGDTTAALEVTGMVKYMICWSRKACLTTVSLANSYTLNVYESDSCSTTCGQK